MAEEELTAAQRAALATLAATRGACPSAEALVEYEALDEAACQAHPIHAHVQVCSRCQLVLLNLEDTAPAAVRARPFWVLPLAAVLAIGVAGSLLYRNLPQEPDVETVRGTELQPIAPVGGVDSAVVFRWQSPIRAEKYRITVFQANELLWTRESVEPQLALPAATLSRGDYEWQVDAIDAEGVVRMSSPRTRFTIR